MKIYLKFFMFFITFWGGIPNCIAQTPIKGEMANLAKSYEMINSTEEIIVLKPDINVAAMQLFRQHKDAFNLGNDHEMRIMKKHTDKLGYTHYRFQQHYKNIPLVGGEMIVHEKNGRVETINGVCIKNIQANNSPRLYEHEALQNVLKSIKSKKFVWQDSLSEKELKKQKKDSLATYYPKGKLVFISSPFSNKGENFDLAYQFDILSLIPFFNDRVWIDANDGKIIKTTPLSRDYTATGTAKTLYDGNSVQIQTDAVDFKKSNGDIDFTQYTLKDNDRIIQVFNMNLSDLFPPSGGSIVDPDNDNIWDSDADNDIMANSAYWGMEKTYDYFYQTLGQHSYDDNDGAIRLYVHAGTNGYDPMNAKWFGPPNNSIYFGVGDGGIALNPLVSLDIVAHEFSHGITDYGANLDYSNESGALDESFADMFATSVEFKYGADPDWLMGEDVVLEAPGYFRSLQNPKSAGQPDTYNGAYWQQSTSNPNESNDYGGVHTNSGIGNFWFYVLAHGRQGTNDDGNFYCVEGIGIDKAADIAHRTLTTYLTPNSDYAAAKQYSIMAATDLYGSTPDVVIQTTNAWYAVGVGLQFNEPINLADHTVTGTENYQYKLPVVVSNFNISSGGNCSIKSEQFIRLQNGFHAASGSTFHAYIGPVDCTAPFFKSDEKNAPNNHEESENISPLYAEKNKYEFSIVPNPSDGRFTISLDTQLKNSELQIRDVLGNLVKSFKTTTIAIEVDLSAQPKGVYFVKIISEQGEVLGVKKVVVQ